MHLPRRHVAGADEVGAAAALHGQGVDRLGPEHVHRCVQPVHRHQRTAAAGDVDLFAGGTALDRHRVGPAVARKAGQRHRHLDRADGAAGHVAQRDGVRAPEGADRHRLDRGHVHADVAQVAGQDRLRRRRLQAERLCRGEAVEDQRVAAAIAVHDVAAVAVVPGEHVVARAQPRPVVAAPAADEVAPGPAAEDIVAAAACDHVVARARIHVETQGQVAAGRQVVGAAARVERDGVARIAPVDPDENRQSQDRGAAVLAQDRHEAVAVAVRQLDPVGQAVARMRALDGRQVDPEFLDRRALQPLPHADHVDAAAREQVDAFDPGHAHGDGAHVAVEPGGAVRVRQLERLVRAVAVEGERVEPALPEHGVAAVAGGPAEDVAAGPQRRRVVAPPARDDVVAAARQDQVVARARAGVGPQHHHAGRDEAGRDRVRVVAADEGGHVILVWLGWVGLV